MRGRYQPGSKRYDDKTIALSPVLSLLSSAPSLLPVSSRVPSGDYATDGILSVKVWRGYAVWAFQIPGPPPAAAVWCLDPKIAPPAASSGWGGRRDGDYETTGK